MNALKINHLPTFALAATLLIFSCKKSSENAAPTGNVPTTGAAPTGVEGFIVKSAPLSEGITASGTLLPAEETELHPEVSGRVVSLNLPEGKTVRKGDLLLKIFDEDLQTQLKKLETQLKTAEITEQRLAELVKVKGISQQEYDLAALQVQNLKNEMELVRVNVGKTELRAPYDGVIGLRSISPGAYVSPATAVTTIRSAAGLKLDFSVPERYAEHIRPGNSVQFSVEGQPEKYAATILASEQSISADARSLKVRAQVKGNPRNLLPGNFAEVNLTLGNKTKALMIPSRAIVPQARDKKVYVSRGGKAVSVVVKTGVRQSEMIEITDGLAAGDTIAVTGILFLRPEGLIRFSKVE